MIIPVLSIEIYLFFIISSDFLWGYREVHVDMCTCTFGYVSVCIHVHMKAKDKLRSYFSIAGMISSPFCFIFIVWERDPPVVRNSPCSVGKTGLPTNPTVHLFLFPQQQDYKLVNWSACLCGFWESNADSAVYTAINL